MMDKGLYVSDLRIITVEDIKVVRRMTLKIGKEMKERRKKINIVLTKVTENKIYEN